MSINADPVGESHKYAAGQRHFYNGWIDLISTE